MVLILCLLPSLPAGAGGSGNDGEWTGRGVKTGQWTQAPGTQVWTDSPSLGNSGYIYKYEPKCFDGDVGYILCLKANTCDEGPDGQYVTWMRSLDIDPRVWENFVDNGPACVYSANPEALLEEVTTLLLSEFQESPVNAGKIASQPGPHTMMGADTNIYVDSQVQIINTELLGQEVKIVATPTEYVLHYGDGTESDLTYDPGAELPDRRIGEPTGTSHVYAATGNFQIHATVYFTAEYSLNGGPMIPIDGRGIFDTPSQTISVWKSESRNVADDCLVNPAGFGC